MELIKITENFIGNEDFTTELGKNNIGRPTKEYILWLNKEAD